SDITRIRFLPRSVQAGLQTHRSSSITPRRGIANRRDAKGLTLSSQHQRRPQALSPDTVLAVGDRHTRRGESDGLQRDIPRPAVALRRLQRPLDDPPPSTTPFTRRIELIRIVSKQSADCGSIPALSRLDVFPAAITPGPF